MASKAKPKAKKTVLQPGFQISPNGGNQQMSENYAQYVFNNTAMAKYISKTDLDKLEKCLENNTQIDAKLADAIALGMKDWAISLGCTHFTHWFQPLTGATAEKHDSLYDMEVKNGKTFNGFTGKQLVQGEPDASSFPSGGIRATFEARGYTGWDASSPAFIVEKEGGNTLCIPTIFVSYTGESLDKKGPLLRSDKALNKASLGILSYFKNKATKVVSNLGAEQEYFIIDRDFYNARADLQLTGRTLFGGSSAKDQQLDDQYFGNIPERAFAYMQEVEEEAYKVGIPLKTRHNEVAPSQYEFAPIFEEANIAVDHNLYLMDLMERVAQRQGLAVLFHEKPFAGINGNGKHNNWSLSTNKGENLLSPGDTPAENLQFLVFLVATIKAVHDNSKILRAAIATSGNDHRLGANEAPPAIISIFLGSTLTKVLDDLEAGKTASNTDKEWMNFGIDHIPSLLKDTTDRNRTSPFAFTGNKFEFRAVGGSATNSPGITILNTIVAESLTQIKEQIDAAIKGGQKFEAAAVSVLKEIIPQSKAVRFEGDNYSADWEKEAESRGLPNIKKTPHALKVFEEKSIQEIFGKHGVLSERELEAWYHVKLERYAKDIDIEAKVMVNMGKTQIVASSIAYQNELASNITAIKENGGDVSAQSALLKELGSATNSLLNGLNEIESARAAAEADTNVVSQAAAYADNVIAKFDGVREFGDKLEAIISDSQWPLPKYQEILFLSK